MPDVHKFMTHVIMNYLYGDLMAKMLNQKYVDSNIARATGMKSLKNTNVPAVIPYFFSMFQRP